jgi:hypothetical protein
MHRRNFRFRPKTHPQNGGLLLVYLISARMAFLPTKLIAS